MIRKQPFRQINFSEFFLHMPEKYSYLRNTKYYFDTDRFCDFLSNLPDASPYKICVLMDNVSFHHSVRVSGILTDLGYAWLFAPPYSPEYNPIEGIFSCFKHRVKTGMSIDEAWYDIPLDAYSNNFRHSMEHRTPV